MFEAARFFEDNFEEFRDPAGLLCVHAAISLNDAIHFAVFAHSLRGDDHRQAVKTLNECCDRKNIKGDQRQGVTQFQELIKLKNEFAYGVSRVKVETVRSAYDRVQKFFAWSYQQFSRELNHDVEA